MHDLLAALSRNMMSLIGTALSLVSGLLIVILTILELFAARGHPYIGILTYIILPTLLFAGLVLMAWGVVRERRRSAKIAFPVIDLNVEKTRRWLIRFVVLVSGFAVILATSTVKAVEFMENNVFCGAVCHEVMAPEYDAFQRSPHASIHCVDCHVGPGASGFIQAKLNGSWQLLAVMLDVYDRPIETPVHHLPFSAVTCEECHWPTKWHGVSPKQITRFADDEANTETKTILLLNVGGNDQASWKGIHWHADPDIQIRYRSDERRKTIHEVELTREDGTVTRYFAPGSEETGHSEWRTMDCTDCHNRPAHRFQDAREALDLALERGFVANDLPFIRREAERAVRTDFASHEQAREGIAAAIAGFYQSEYAGLADERAADIEQAGRVLGQVYESNVFPTMKIGWGTYPDHSGHDDSIGCFRCHAGDHVTTEGQAISVDCRICHTIVAWDEASPEILELIRSRGTPVGVGGP